MVFVVLEGFSGTGKTTLAKRLEEQGWLRLKESAHAVPREVPVADRADTFADFSLIGATLVYSSLISKFRPTRDIVSEGYLLSDLAYARIRYDLNKSTAYPAMLAFCKEILKEPLMRPDLYVLLRAGSETINQRQRHKNMRERNVTEFFRTRYYTALSEIHDQLQQTNVEKVRTDDDATVTMGRVLTVLDLRRTVRS